MGEGRGREEMHGGGEEVRKTWRKGDGGGGKGEVRIRPKNRDGRRVERETRKGRRSK